jgi:hypothetical protein
MPHVWGAGREENMTIQVKQANLETVSVQIQVLKVGSKQMTLSVFRQLDEEPAFNEWTGKLKGSLWGRVNYTWAGHDNCVHVVWQYGDELRRDCLHWDGHAALGALNSIRALSLVTRLGSHFRSHDRLILRVSDLEKDCVTGSELREYLQQHYHEAKMGCAIFERKDEEVVSFCEQEHERIKQRYVRFRESIELLPHLFIAV